MARNHFRLQWPWYCGVVCALLIGSLLLYRLVDKVLQLPLTHARQFAVQAREAVNRQGQSIPSGMEHQIRLGSRYDPRKSKLESDALLAEIPDFHGPCGLSLEGVPNLDEFLTQIRGLKGLRKLVLFSCELRNPAAGMDSIATLPDLESLFLSEVRLTGVELQKLNAAPKLTDVWITYFPDSDVKVADVLSLPNLRKVGLAESHRWESVSWLRQCVDDLPQTLSLEELTLCRIQMSPEQVQELRQRYPNCVIKVMGYNEKEIAPLPKSE